MGSLETRQAEEASAPVGAILPSVAKEHKTLMTQDDPLTQLRADLRQIGGRTILTETQMGKRRSGDVSDG